MSKTKITRIDEVIIMMEYAMADGHMEVPVGQEYQACIALYHLGKSDKDTLNFETLDMEEFTEEEFLQEYQKLIDSGRIIFDTEGCTIH